MALGAQPVKGAHDAITLLASAVRTATAGTNGSSVRLQVPRQGFIFTLTQTNAATDADDTLDVQVQTLIGSDWIAVCSFTQLLGNGTDATTVVAKIISTAAQAMFTNAALTAGTVRHLFGDEWRVSYAIVDPSGTNASFTFGVTAEPF